MNLYVKLLPMDDPEYTYLSRHVFDLNYDLLMERLSLKIKWRRYGIDDMLDNAILKAEGVAYKKPKGHSFKTEILHAYKELSGFDHISIDSLHELEPVLNCSWTLVHCSRFTHCLFIFIDDPLLGILIPGMLNRRLYALISVGCSLT